MAAKKITTKGRKKKGNVGCKGGDFLMPVSFRSATVTTSLMRDIQTHYRTGYFSQEDLAGLYKIPLGIVSKICRIAKENGGEPITS